MVQNDNLLPFCYFDHKMEGHLYLVCLISIFLRGSYTLQATSTCARRSEADTRCGISCYDDPECGSRKTCLCDGPCGMSCLKRGRKCRRNYYKAPINGNRTVSGNKLGDTIVYSCKRGYTLVGPSVLTCSGIRKWKPWDQGEPKCVMGCASPKLPPSAVIRRNKKDRYTYGDRVYFACKRGYGAFGSSYVKCMRNGWSKAKLHCRPKSCGSPGQLRNGRVIASFYTYGNKVTYVCNKGYRLIGLETRTCLSKQKWSGRRPICKVKHCDPKPQLENGKYEGLSTAYGTKRSAKCNIGYMLQGSSQIICNGDNWEYDRAISKCVKHCRPTPHLENGKFEGLSTAYGAKRSAKCNIGYMLQGSSQIICNGDNWEYDRAISKCVVKHCRPTPHLENGKFEGLSTAYGAKRSAKCNIGYMLQGSSQIICNGDNWEYDRAISKCVVKHCRPTPHLENGKFEGLSTAYGAKRSAKCNIGYMLQGSSQIICNGDNWEYDRAISKCVVKHCRPTPHLENGKFEGLSTAYGAKRSAKCNIGYMLQGSSQIICNGDNWEYDRAISKCVVKHCHTKPKLENGKYEGLSTAYGAKRSAKCNIGYMLQGSSQIICNGDNWEYDRAISKCVEVPIEVKIKMRYVGCFKDRIGRALLPMTILRVASLKKGETFISKCLTLCKERNQPYAGLQFHEECYCFQNYKRYGQAPESDCNRQCMDSRGKCGGALRNSVYNTMKWPSFSFD
ncbi:sushi, von Willebrand factor type A, EGF and pentraxin domain-containing protein 1-like isoform X2 [Rhopilema esculentum]|uniref:sushi, von Willebrand factor type A, EGF and pentraxin domain-containing protein 1-like isoform X2 n=1 Tax=Rhopilema esculentum TaxID=499914 RepID=UPI0031D2B63F